MEIVLLVLVLVLLLVVLWMLSELARAVAVLMGMASEQSLPPAWRRAARVRHIARRRDGQGGAAREEGP